MKVGAIIAAAGFGRRMKTDRPKQLLALNGTPILVHTIRKFDASNVIDYIIVTAPREAVAVGWTRRGDGLRPLGGIRPDRCFQPGGTGSFALKRRSKVLETVKRETDGASHYPMGIQTIHFCSASWLFSRSTECPVGWPLGCYRRYLICMFVSIKYEKGILHGGR
jgi:hypothetical protein